MTPEQVAEAMERIDRGDPIKAIASDLGVAATTVSKWLYRAELHGLGAWTRKGRHLETCGEMCRQLLHEGSMDVREALEEMNHVAKF